MVEVVLVLAAAAVGAGYLVSLSELLADAQLRWGRAADVLDAHLHGELEAWAVAFEQWDPADDPPLPWGMVAVDTRVLPDLDAAPSRRLWLRWARYALLRCHVCVGWHAAWLLLASWSAVAWLVGDPAPVSWGAAVPIWLASGAVHTVVSKKWLS